MARFTKNKHVYIHTFIFSKIIYGWNQAKSRGGGGGGLTAFSRFINASKLRSSSLNVFLSNLIPTSSLFCVIQDLWTLQKHLKNVTKMLSGEKTSIRNNLFSEQVECTHRWKIQVMMACNPIYTPCLFF